MAGRPTIYSEALALAICTRLTEGISLRTICLDEDMPSISAVINWLADGAHETFVAQYTRAREAQADRMAEEILEISNTPVLGIKTKTTDGRTEVTEGDMIEHRRLQVDARKWLAARMAPKKYGDRIKQEVTGKDDGPIENKWTIEFVNPTPKA